MPGIEQDKNAVMPLVSTQWLADHLEDPTVVILEVSIDPPTTADYAVGHIPGALFVYRKDLLWHESDREFPSTEVVPERLRTLGVNDDTTIALVGDPLQFGAYAYWVMTMTGQEERCRLVDGGRRTWVAEKRPLVTDVAAPPIGDLTQGTADVSSRIGRDEVRAGLGPDGPCWSTCARLRNTEVNASPTLAGLRSRSRATRPHPRSSQRLHRQPPDRHRQIAAARRTARMFRGCRRER